MKLKLPDVDTFPELFGSRPLACPTAREAAPFLKTLRLLPKHVILEIAGSELDLLVGNYCVCGLAYKSAIAKALKVDITDVDSHMHRGTDESIPSACARVFGGTPVEWADIYFGVTNQNMPAIELAFVQRLQECLYPSEAR